MTQIISSHFLKTGSNTLAPAVSFDTFCKCKKNKNKNVIFIFLSYILKQKSYSYHIRNPTAQWQKFTSKIPTQLKSIWNSHPKIMFVEKEKEKNSRTTSIVYIIMMLAGSEI